MFALSTLAAFLLLARTETLAASCTPDANVTADCSSLVINNPNQTITIQAGATVYNPSSMAIWFKPSATGITFINNGTISSRSETLFNQGTITSFVNNGVIGPGFHFYSQSGSIGTLTKDVKATDFSMRFEAL